MLVEEHPYAKAEAERKSFQERVAREGMSLWKKQKEQESLRRKREKQELKQILENYWPWETTMDKPRGLRNLRLEGIFPNNDFEKAKRFAGTFGTWRGGGGAPLYSDTGKKITRTREDPLLRFQFGRDCRNCVDNILRYKKNKAEQDEYREQLDKLVEEKKFEREKQKRYEQERLRHQYANPSPWGKPGPGGRPWRHPFTIGLNFFKSLGWSNEETLREVDAENDKFKKINIVKPNQVITNKPMVYPGKNIFTVIKDRKLSPLRDSKDQGAELVTLMAKQRRNNVRAPLTSTDVTYCGKYYDSSIWRRTGSAYLKELKQQMNEKRQQLQQIKNIEHDGAQKHISTLDNYWGRPGHGAPLSNLRKQRLDPMMYPQMVPIYVH